MIGNYVTTDFIIEKAQSQLPSTATFNPSEIKEWLYEGMKKTGGAHAYGFVTTIELELEEGRCYIPQYIDSIMEVRYDTIMLNRTTVLNRMSNFQYVIMQNYLYSDIQSGIIELDVLQFPVDANNRPLIPDVSYYINAMVAYVCERIAWKLFINDTMTELKYKYFKDNWIFYCGSTKTRLLPRKDEEYELWKTMRQIPAIHRGLKVTQITRNVPKLEMSNLNDLIYTQAPVGTGIPIDDEISKG